MSRIRRPPLGMALFFVLLAASVLSAVLVVRARTPNLVLEVTHQPETLAGDDARISFFVREADGHARVAIVDSHEDVVRTLDEDVALSEEQTVTYVWDRHSDTGGDVPPGRYRLLVELPSEDRVMVWPRRITVLPRTGGAG